MFNTPSPREISTIPKEPYPSSNTKITRNGFAMVCSNSVIFWKTNLSREVTIAANTLAGNVIAILMVNTTNSFLESICSSADSLDPSTHSELIVSMLPNTRATAEKMRESENLRKGLPAFLRLSGYSHTHLARLVKCEFGCTLHEYIFKLRLEEAYRRIAFTGEHFESISRNVGYESFSHFNRREFYTNEICMF